MKILLLEDELMLQHSIDEYLETLGHKCCCFGDGNSALVSLNNETYDLLILDINVPNINGIQLFQYIQEQQNFTPVIFSSAIIDINTIVEAFDLGAKDYLKKPFHLKELGIKVQQIASNLKNNYNSSVILTKNYKYSKENNNLYYNNVQVKLTKKQLLIIQTLCNNINNIVTLETLRYHVWDSEPVSNATIRTEISRLKKILYDDFIQNRKGIGYKTDRYIAPIS